MNQFPIIAVIVVAGMMLAVQAPINAGLARHAGGVFAAAVSFGAGFVVLLAVAAAASLLPRPATLAQAPWWAWTGGALGAFYVWAALWSVPRVGAVTLAAALVLGQMMAALVIDRFGLFGVSVQPASWARLAGAAMVAGGLVLSRL